MVLCKPKGDPSVSIVCRGFESPILEKTHFLYDRPLFVFLPVLHPHHPSFLQDFSENIGPLKYWINTKINSCGNVNFGRLKNDVTCLFCKQHFYKQHLAEIKSEKVTISSTKRSQKNNTHSTWKTCLVKSTTPTKSISY